MSSAAPSNASGLARSAAAPRPALRPLVLPTEHGGWGFLFEPLLLALIVAPSAGGFLIAVAALFGFLARQPLKLAMQDFLRGKPYPRTAWCRGFAAGYLLVAFAAICTAVGVAGPSLLIPFAIVTPLAIVVLFADARNRSRALLPELAGSIAMASTAAAIALAAGRPLFFAFVVSSLVVLRGIPSILYVRTLVTRSHKQVASSWPALVAHVIAVAFAYAAASYVAALACAALLARAAWGLAHDAPRAQTLGWREIAWGVFSVAMFAVAIR